ncbi:MDR family MFS transporter [Paenibacillus sp. FSL W8-0426]|uniref:MDR family MFS transporter n=1 Tax=Paenibacillus sp. FSL W8-0426 TaxID=2921714 RepID=UPI0030DDB301
MSQHSLLQEQPKESSFSIRPYLPPLIAIVIGTFMVILDSTAVNVALPTWVRDFGVTLQTMQWAVTAYTLALSAVIPLAGWLSDKFGAKRVFLSSIGFFTLGSLLCAFAQTSGQLILFRVIQGLGGGMVSPVGMAMVYRLAPPDKRGSIIGMLGIPMLLAPALGPVISGWLVEYVSWHWIFWINLPIGLAGIWIGMKHLPSFQSQANPRLDVLGLFLGPAAFACLTFGFSEAGSGLASSYALWGLSAGTVLLALFVISCLVQREPLLELRVMKSGPFTIGIITSWIMQTALFGTVLLFPLLLQQVKQLGPLATGLHLLPQAIGSMIFMPLAGKWFDKMGARPPLTVGMLLISGGLFAMSIVGTDYGPSFIMLILFALGSGMGLSMMSLNTYVLNATPPQMVSRVTPLTSASQQVVSSFAIAGFTGYLSSRITNNAGKELSAMDAHTAAFSDTFWLAACIATVGLVCSFLLKKKTPSAKKGSSSSVNDSNERIHEHDQFPL